MVFLCGMRKAVLFPDKRDGLGQTVRRCGLGYYCKTRHPCSAESFNQTTPVDTTTHLLSNALSSPLQDFFSSKRNHQSSRDQSPISPLVRRYHRKECACQFNALGHPERCRCWRCSRGRNISKPANKRIINLSIGSSPEEGDRL